MSTDRYADRFNPNVRKAEEYSGDSSVDSIIKANIRYETKNQPEYRVKTRKVLPRGVKIVLVILSILLGCIALFELGSILFTSVIYPKLTGRQHEQEVNIGFSDISKADSTARALFKFELKNDYWPGGHHSHFYDFIRDDYGICRYNHIERGLELLKYAADLGDSSAQFSLGCYYAGADFRTGAEDSRWGDRTMDGKALNYEKAAYWYLKAAEQGNGSAMNNLANCYKHGNGVEKDSIKAVEWYKKSAQQGAPWAQHNLAICYEKGEGVRRNYRSAIKWYTKAAEQGAVLSQFNLAACYEEGQGVEKDIRKAIYWYNEAAKQGSRSALKKLEILRKKREDDECPF